MTDPTPAPHAVDTIHVHAPNWAAFKALKHLIADVLQGPLLRELSQLLQGPLTQTISTLIAHGGVVNQSELQEQGVEPDDFMASLQASFGDLAEHLPALIASAVEATDKFDLWLVTYCTSVEPSAFEELPVERAIELRERAIEAADIPTLLAREKNYLVLLASKASGILGSTKTTQ